MTRSTPFESSFLSNRQTRLWLVVLTAATVLAFSPIFSARFTNWDDQKTVVSNELIRLESTHDLWMILSSASLLGHYQPLVYLSYAADYAIAGFDPVVFHGTNLLLHCMNVWLAAWFIWHVTKNRSIVAFVAVCFALHPLRVEPVAWISSRKDLLYAFFYLAALVAYESRTVKRRNVLVIVLFILSSLAKSMAMTLPLVLLLLDWHRDGSWKRSHVVNKIPYIVISLCVGLVAILTQQGAGAIQSSQPWWYGPFAAAYGMNLYLWKMVLPTGLSAFYSYPAQAQAIFFLAPLTILLAGILLYSLRSFLRFALFGAAFFVATLLPVIQLLPVGGAVAADRYTYIPMLGLFLMCGECVERLLSRSGRESQTSVLVGILFVLATVLGVMTWRQAQVWQDSETLWTNVLEKSPDLPIALYNRAEAYRETGALDKAETDYTRLLAVSSADARALNSRGAIRQIQGRYSEALSDYTSSIAVDTTQIFPYINRGHLHKEMGQDLRALEDYSRAMSKAPDRGDIAALRAGVLYRTGKKNESLADISRAIAGGYETSDGQLLRGRILYETGDAAGAVAAFTRSLQLRPDGQDAVVLRAYARAAASDLAGAREDVLHAQARGYQFPPAFLRSIANDRP